MSKNSHTLEWIERLTLADYRYCKRLHAEQCMQHAHAKLWCCGLHAALCICRHCKLLHSCGYAIQAEAQLELQLMLGDEDEDDPVTDLAADEDHRYASHSPSSSLSKLCTNRSHHDSLVACITVSQTTQSLTPALACTCWTNWSACSAPQPSLQPEDADHTAQPSLSPDLQ